MLSAQQRAFARHKVAQEIARYEGREAMSDSAWCHTMGLHINTGKKYAHNPEVKALVEAEVRDAKESKDFFKSVMRRVALEELWVQYDKAKGAEKRHFLSMILDLTKDVAETTEMVDFRELSDDDLIAKCLNRNTSEWGMSEQALLARLKGDVCYSSLESVADSSLDSSAESTSTNGAFGEGGMPGTLSDESRASLSSLHTKTRSKTQSSGKSSSRRPKSKCKHIWKPIEVTEKRVTYQCDKCSRHYTGPNDPTMFPKGVVILDSSCLST